MRRLRGLENAFYQRVRSADAETVAQAEPCAWEPARLGAHKYCLLTSYRASGQPVATPVWFGPAGELIYVRSGGQDGKVKRIRRNSRVLVAPCTARGAPLGPPMAGRARILATAQQEAAAEAALRRRYGLGRRLYRLLRRRPDAVYLEIAAHSVPG